MQQLWHFIKEVVAEWQSDNGPRLAAALSYYALFSIAPLLLISAAAITSIYGRAGGEAQFMDTASEMVGPGPAQALSDIMKTASDGSGKTTATILGFAFLLFAASSVFTQLSQSLNWMFRCGKCPKPSFWALVRERILSIVAVISVGVLLVASMLFSAAVSRLQKYSAEYVGRSIPLWKFVDYGISFLLVLVSFAFLYKFLPHTMRVRWRYAFAGAATAGALFAILKSLFALYIGAFNPASAFGAAGSFVVILLLVYFAAQVFFLGAEVTKVLANRGGQKELSLA